jgi:cytoskeletal protein RodZ
MERDDYDALPGIVYAQGFLKTYANYLDLDGEKLAQELKHQQSAGPARSATDEPNGRSERPDYRGGASGAGRFLRNRRKRLSPITIIGLVLGLLLLVIVVAGLYFVGLQASRSSSEDAGGNPQASESAASPEQDNASQSPEGGTPEEEANNDAGAGGAAQGEPSLEEAEQQDASGAIEEAPEAAPTPEPPPAPEPVEPPPPESLTMEVRVEGNISWLNIETDGEVVFVEVAEPGFVQTFEAEESITVWSGNAGAVFLSLNGQDYGQFGESGQTKIQEFTLKNAEN